MNIGFDAKRFFLNRTGLGNYSRSTISILAKYYPEHDYFLYTPKVKEQFTKLLAHHKIQVRTPENFLTRKFHPFWRSIFLGQIIEKDNLHIYHGLSHEIPLIKKSNKTKLVVTIHDLIFLKHPELYSKFDILAYTFKYKKSCQNAHLIVAISEQTKKDIIEYFNINEQKIKVIYQSCDPNFYAPVSAGEKEKVKKKYHLPDNFILYVGALAPRKNLITLLRALSLVPEEIRVPLVLVGQGKTYKQKLVQKIHELKLDNKVKFLDFVPTNDLPALYQQATVFVYPSLYEGFGIPILEALFSNTPVITSKGSCFREAGGTSSIYVDPHSPEELAQALGKVIKDEELRQQMASIGYSHAQKFHQENVAKKLMQAYLELGAS
ncbi:glycosyltransferase family 4 protein [Desulfohalobiaceae bacterium Ax17]|uniref:glycosyltransferase family 4 protein n=1 Tax=Desulfovulcanus ferrireducens TaxID=2831190 RepID=UPI00207BA18F|nr:glycosyltransferase family 1 protein [Desulfovulcanus ferrireducens]MBT8762390.1 glycosyltransferase family 4 protein [Desulfovulcanus ferrireducens]